LSSSLAIDSALKVRLKIQTHNSKLRTSVVIRSDAYHIAAADADECVGHTLEFLKEQRR
jgi:hypothetical protein